LRGNESSTCSLLEYLRIIVIDHSKSIARNISLLGLVIAEEFILVSEAKLLHARDHHLSDLLLLYSFLNLTKKNNLILGDS